MEKIVSTIARIAGTFFGLALRLLPEKKAYSILRRLAGDDLQPKMSNKEMISAFEVEQGLEPLADIYEESTDKKDLAS